jgi:hypothetical protein
MKVRIIRETFVDGEIVKPSKGGVDLPEATARQLITAGKALPIATAPDHAANNRENGGSGSSET